MPRFDYQCESPDCAYIARNLYVPVADVDVIRACPACGFDMQKLPSAPNFSVKGYNAANGYTHK